MNMKTLVTILVSVFFLTMLCKAQTPTPLTSSDFPHPGDSSDVKEYTIPPTQSYPDDSSVNDSLSIDRTLQKALQAINDIYMEDIQYGGNQTDTIPLIIYQQIPGVKSYHRVYEMPNSFVPGAASFPNATTYTFMNTADGPAYIYYENETNGFYELGSYLMPSGNPAITMVNNPKKPICAFPLDYNVPANVVGYNGTASGGGITNTTGMNITVDAYGTLVLVSGSVSNPTFTTYNNFLRTVQSSNDVMDLGYGMAYSIESKFYNYYVPGQFDPIIVYSVAKIRSNIDPTLWSLAGQWEDEIAVQWNTPFINTDIAENKWEINLFPNPSDGMFTLNLPAFHNNNIIAEVYDYNGKLILNETYSGGLIQLDLTDQQNGIYLLKLNSNGYIITSKIVISK